MNCLNWIEINNPHTSMPEIGQQVLIYGGSWEIGTVTFHHDDANSEPYFQLMEGSILQPREWPTHWMPLPDPPIQIESKAVCGQCGTELELRTFKGHYFFFFFKACAELKAGTPEDKPIRPEIIHGKTCCKEIHRLGRAGYMHGPEDDSPYYVEINGPMYCGRCHEVLP